MSMKNRFMPNGKRMKPNLSHFEKVTSINQLQEGMVLIDKYACKRTILSITPTTIWLSHKYGLQSKTTGKTWPIDKFMRDCPNWIFKK